MLEYSRTLFMCTLFKRILIDRIIELNCYMNQILPGIGENR